MYTTSINLSFLSSLVVEMHYFPRKQKFDGRSQIFSQGFQLERPTFVGRILRND